MSDLCNHCHSDAPKRFDSLVQTKANLCHMLLGIADFAFVGIVNIGASGRCIRSLIFALNTSRIFVQFLCVFFIL